MKCEICGVRIKRGDDLCGPCFQEAMIREGEQRTIWDSVMDNPQVQGLLDRALGVVSSKIDQGVDKVVGRIDGYARIFAQQAQRPQGAPARPVRTPREILHFGPNEPLDIEKIKTRWKQIASYLHSDKGGNDEMMKIINAAKDKLIKEVNG